MARKTRTRSPKRASGAATAPSSAAHLAAARREKRRLRELKVLMGRIRRSLVDAGDAQVETARVLVAGTGFSVIDNAYVEELRSDREAAIDLGVTLRERVAILERQLNPATV